MVREDHVGASTFDAGEDFQSDSAFIDPAVEGGGLDHGVFAGDVRGRNGQVRSLAHLADDTQVSQCGLDQHDVGTLFDVQVNLFECFPAVGGIHLIGGSVAKLWGG